MHIIKKLGLIISVVVITLTAGFFTSQFLDAKTTVTENPNDECEYTVTVDIAFAFLDQGSQDKADDLIKTWTEAMTNTWNGPSGNQTFGDCDCKVKFVFNVQKLAKGKDCRQAPAGYHCINVVNQAANQRGNVADVHTVRPDGSTNGFGEWTTGASGVDAAHEAGHLMGLADEYEWKDTDGDGKKELVNKNPQTNADGTPADQQSIMATTEGNVGPTQEHIDDIMTSAGVICPSTCCCGDGKVDGQSPIFEDCDPKANPNGCGEGQTCEEDCTCSGGKEPECGDGEINGIEMCDDNASPTGCEANQTCENCFCFDNEEPPAPADTPTPPPAPAGDNDDDTTADQPAGDNDDDDTPVAGDDDEETTQTVCGDGICDEGENCDNCRNDCGYCLPVCGDDTCEATESCDSCEEDCGSCPSECGDGVCEGDETCSTCESDCGTCAPVCGDGACEGSEDCSSCEQDCGSCGAVCGDGLCDTGEDCTSCPGDCGECLPYCGDGVCDQGEDCNLCYQDCGECPLFACEDGIDNDGDLLIDFPADPGCYDYTDDDEFNEWCGDGICQIEYGENPIDCPLDCEEGPVDA